MRRVALLVGLLALMLGSGTLALDVQEPPQAGHFSNAGVLPEHGDGSAVALLADGRVAVVGGFTLSLAGLFDDAVAAEGMSSAVDVWDPVSGESTPAGSLVEAREGHTATLLEDGRVLVIGGSAYDDLLASAEVWDPATGETESTGSLAKVRRDHTATLLLDGRILVIGGDGFGKQSYTHARAEIWDPETGAFAPAGSLKHARSLHSATLLADGRVLIVGGTDWFGERTPLRKVEVWDPTTARFTRTGSLPEARLGHTATLLSDGRVLIVGGGWYKDPPTTALVWDPATGKFTPAGRLPEPRLYHSATLLPDGRVLIVGGYRDDGGPLLDEVFSSALLWDPATSEFSPAGSLQAARAGHAALPLGDGRVVIAGGFARNGEDAALVEVWESGAAAAEPVTRGGSEATSPLAPDDLASLLPQRVGSRSLTAATPDFDAALKGDAEERAAWERLLAPLDKDPEDVRMAVAATGTPGRDGTSVVITALRVVGAPADALLEAQLSASSSDIDALSPGQQAAWEMVAGRNVFVLRDLETGHWLVWYPKGEVLFTGFAEPDAGVTIEDLLAGLP